MSTTLRGLFDGGRAAGEAGKARLKALFDKWTRESAVLGKRRRGLVVAGMNEDQLFWQLEDKLQLLFAKAERLVDQFQEAPLSAGEEQERQSSQSLGGRKELSEEEAESEQLAEAGKGRSESVEDFYEMEEYLEEEQQEYATDYEFSNENDNEDQRSEDRRSEGPEDEAEKVIAAFKDAAAEAEPEAAGEIGRLESELLAEKNWQLKGELFGKERTANSLLEAELQFKGRSGAAGSRPAVDELIRQRVAEQLFDDRRRVVVRPPREAEPGAAQEQSKKGLAEVYEDEVRAAVKIGEDDKDRTTKERAAGLFGELCYGLELLCNWDFLPNQQRAGEAEALGGGEAAGGKARGAKLAQSKEEMAAGDNRKARRTRKRLWKAEGRIKRGKEGERVVGCYGETKAKAKAKEAGKEAKAVGKGNKGTGKSVPFTKHTQFFENLQRREGNGKNS